MDKSYEVSSKARVYDGFFKIDRMILTSDGIKGAYVREVFERGRSACVLVYDPRLDKVLLVEELRPGAVAAGLNNRECWSLGPIAGSMDKAGEDPAATILREALEEAGFDLGPAVMIGPLSTMPSPGGSSEVISHFIAFADLSGVVDGQTFGVDGEHEATTVRILDCAEATDLLFDGVCNGLTATLLMWLSRLDALGQIRMPSLEMEQGDE